MLKYLKEYRFYIILFLFILIPVIALDTNQRVAREYRFYDKVIITVTAPIQTAITLSLDLIISTFNNYVYLWYVRKNNTVLLEENRNLLNTIVKLRETQDENERLRNLLKFKEEYQLTTLVARVIAKDVSTEFRSIRINRGELHGIKKDMPVVNNEGIVGRVLRTTQTTSDIVTLLDLQSAVDGLVKRTRIRGIVEGMTDEVCFLKFALRTDDIVVGDVLLSSGLGGIFPKGVPIGTVSKVDRKPYGITQSVEIRPSVDFSRLEEVLVITNHQNLATVEPQTPPQSRSKAN